ncbi:hypothetical protein CANTEDRAFT_123705 [Yamadazyma tenuis ATCC 10573]|uniref:Uncharacterized protein n=1 Tax=Candida tenuis (strain ATCC 10573 / BCRC 21748 / CBS 615 / JCM 9827 / NBRC 10315 / NRRL Y-1498 / VKM Y-70) TaxID=590646 RepID=G3B6D3_CANTC|nr:uncharacterized protein CANTEDRAFT_123705 [Yamadazyma tenuis ATCC 10573]EGV63438.1 hypothetical protein CANTEDRAFT_123705 [Yamadazyma tenuis ATCC 10573]
MQKPSLTVWTNDNESHDDFFQYAKVDVRAPDTVADAGRSRSHTFKSTLPDDISSVGSIPPVAPTSPISNDSQNPNSPAFKRYRVAAAIFFGISITSALVIIALQAYMYAVINIHKELIPSESKFEEVSIYLALFIFAAVFQVLISAIGLRSQNMLLLGFLCVFYGCMLIYTGIQYEEVHKLVGAILVNGWKRATRATNIATICIIAATMVSQVVLIVYYLKRHVSWFRYKSIGADLLIRRMYLTFQVHRSLLVFGFFFFLAFTIQFIIIMVRDKTSVEFILTVIVIPLTIVLLVLSDLGVGRENLWLTGGCLMVYLGGIAYVLFKMIRLFTKYTSAYNVAVVPGAYFPGRSSLITFGVITLVFLVLIVVAEVVLMCEEGKA